MGSEVPRSDAFRFRVLADGGVEADKEDVAGVGDEVWSVGALDTGMSLAALLVFIWKPVVGFLGE